MIYFKKKIESPYDLEKVLSYFDIDHFSEEAIEFIHNFYIGVDSDADVAINPNVINESFGETTLTEFLNDNIYDVDFDYYDGETTLLQVAEDLLEKTMISYRIVDDYQVIYCLNGGY